MVTGTDINLLVESCSRYSFMDRLKVLFNEKPENMIVPENENVGSLKSNSPYALNPRLQTRHIRR